MKPQTGERDTSGEGGSTTQTDEHTDKQTKWRINRQLLPLKLFYFFFYGACGAVIPFITVYLKHLHLSASETGVITGLSVFLAMVARAVVGMLADKFNARKTALLICCFGFGFVFFSMWFLPQREGIYKSNGNSTLTAHLSVHSPGPDQNYVWSCSSDTGEEICVYPATPGHKTCKLLSSYSISESPVEDFGAPNVKLSLPEQNLPKIRKTFTQQVHSNNTTERDQFEDADYIPATSRHSVEDNKIPEEVLMTDQTLAQLHQQENLKTPCFVMDYNAIHYNTLTVSYDAEPTSAPSEDKIGTGTEKPIKLPSKTKDMPIQSENDVLASFENQDISVQSKDRFGSRSVRDVGSAPSVRNVRFKEAVTPTKLNTIQCLINCLKLPLSEEFRNDDHELNGSSGHIADNGELKTSGGKEGERIYHNITPDFVFLLSFLLITTSRSFYSASTSLTDAVTYTALGPSSFKWGQQRLWGTIGTAVAVLAATAVNDRLKGENYTGLFFACLGLTIMACIVGAAKLRADKAPRNKAILKDVKQLLSSYAMGLFLCKLLFYGIMCGTAQNFFFWFLVDLGCSQITLGVCLLVYCTSSVIILRCSSQVLRRIGQINTMYIVLVCYTIRFLVFSFLTNAWLALPVEILHGVTYSLFWAAASSTASMAAPRGTQATCQAIAGAIYWDMGRGLGNILTGQILELVGARWTFRSYSIACAVVLPVFWALDRHWAFRQKRQEDNGKKSIGDKGNSGMKLLSPADIVTSGSSSRGSPSNDKNNNKKLKKTNTQKHDNTEEAKTLLATTSFGNRDSSDRQSCLKETTLVTEDEIDGHSGVSLSLEKRTDLNSPQKSQSKSDVLPVYDKNPSTASASGEHGKVCSSTHEDVETSNGETENRLFIEYDSSSLGEWAESFVLSFDDTNTPAVKFSEEGEEDEDSIGSLSNISSTENGLRIMTARPKSDSLVPAFSLTAIDIDLENESDVCNDCSDDNVKDGDTNLSDSQGNSDIVKANPNTTSMDIPQNQIPNESEKNVLVDVGYPNFNSELQTEL